MRDLRGSRGRRKAFRLKKEMHTVRFAAVSDRWYPFTQKKFLPTPMSGRFNARKLCLSAIREKHLNAI